MKIETFWLSTLKPIRGEATVMNYGKFELRFLKSIDSNDERFDVCFSLRMNSYMKEAFFFPLGYSDMLPICKR